MRTWTFCKVQGNASMRGNCILLLVDWESFFDWILIIDSHFSTGTQKMVFRIYWLLLRPFVLSSTWTFIFATWPFLSCKMLHRVQLTILKSTQQISINCEHGYFVNVFLFFSFYFFFFLKLPLIIFEHFGCYLELDIFLWMIHLLIKRHLL